jgi:hypothetical protein
LFRTPQSLYFEKNLPSAGRVPFVPKNLRELAVGLRREPGLASQPVEPTFGVCWGATGETPIDEAVEHYLPG